MNFTEAVSEVMSMIKRPDKIAAARREVNAAINFYSLETTFAFDRNEQTVALDNTVYAQSIPLATFTRFRKVDCMRPAGRKKFFDSISPDKIFSTTGCDETDVWYLAGAQLNIRSSVLDSSLLIAYYSYPPVLTDAVDKRDHWMLQISPYMIIEKAASSIFRDIGDKESFTALKFTADEKFTSAKRDYKYGANVG